MLQALCHPGVLSSAFPLHNLNMLIEQHDRRNAVIISWLCGTQTACAVPPLQLVAASCCLHEACADPWVAGTGRLLCAQSLPMALAASTLCLCHQAGSCTKPTHIGTRQNWLSICRQSSTGCHMLTMHIAALRLAADANSDNTCLPQNTQCGCKTACACLELAKLSGCRFGRRIAVLECHLRELTCISAKVSR